MDIIRAVEFSKVLMSVFIMAYAYYFLRRSEAYVERKPWEYLYVASMLLFLVELIAALQLFRGEEYSEQIFSDLRSIFELAFLGFFLFSFISQHSLLLTRRILVISQAKASDMGAKTPFFERKRIGGERIDKELEELAKDRPADAGLKEAQERVAAAEKAFEEEDRVARRKEKTRARKASRKPKPAALTRDAPYSALLADSVPCAPLAPVAPVALPADAATRAEDEALLRRCERAIIATESLLRGEAGKMGAAQAAKLRADLDPLERAVAANAPAEELRPLLAQLLGRPVPPVRHAN